MLDEFIYREFNTWICIDANNVEHILPCAEVEIKAIPYVGSGSTVERLWNGSKKFNTPEWEYEVMLKWAGLSQEDNAAILRCLNNMLIQGDSGNGSVFYPRVQEKFVDVEQGHIVDYSKYIKTIPEVGENDIRVIFNQGFRKRPAQLKLVSFGKPEATIKQWLVQ